MNRAICTKNFSVVLACGALLMLSACDRQKKDETTPSSRTAGSDVLLSLAGKPVVTVADFEEFYDQTLEQQPQIAQFAAFMPDFKENLYTTLASYKVLEHWVRKNKIDQKVEFKKDREMLVENVDRSLALKYFQLEHPVKVSDSDLKAYYEENKEMVYLMSPAGVAATGVRFDNEKDATAFLAKAKKSDDIAKVASDEKLTANNFGRVNDQSKNISNSLKTEILSFSSFPTTKLISDSGVYWVVQAQSKDEAKYYAFEQAKEDARARLTAERSHERLTEEIENLKKSYQMLENKSYFQEKKEAAVNEQAAMQQAALEHSANNQSYAELENAKTLVDELPAQQA